VREEIEEPSERPMMAVAANVQPLEKGIFSLEQRAAKLLL
jgi:hypothetical protein